MNSQEYIRNILEQLKINKTRVQLVLTGRDYERLSLISDIKTEGGRSFVLIDLPQSFDADVPNHDLVGIKVEFPGKDKVQHTFSSRITKMTKTDLWLEFPSSIERIQRRQFFRIAPPPDTRISFLRMGKTVECTLINLSEGGALITPQGPLRGALKMMLGDPIRNLRLQCKIAYLHTDIRIGKAVIRREQTDPGSEHTSYAMQFLEMDSKERRALQEFVFRCQREVPRRRSDLEKDE